MTEEQKQMYLRVIREAFEAGYSIGYKDADSGPPRDYGSSLPSALAAWWKDNNLEPLK